MVSLAELRAVRLIGALPYPTKLKFRPNHAGGRPKFSVVYSPRMLVVTEPELYLKSILHHGKFLITKKGLVLSNVQTM